MIASILTCARACSSKKKTNRIKKRINQNIVDTMKFLPLPSFFSEQLLVGWSLSLIFGFLSIWLKMMNFVRMCDMFNFLFWSLEVLVQNSFLKRKYDFFPYNCYVSFYVCMRILVVPPSTILKKKTQHLNTFHVWDYTSLKIHVVSQRKNELCRY